MNKQPITQKDFFEFISEKPIAFNPVFARLTGSITAGLLLSQLLYWNGKGKNPEWFYKTIAEIEQETALSRREQDTAIAKLKKLGIIEVKLTGVPPKRHFKLNLAVLYKLIWRNRTNCFVQTSQNITDNTTDNTTDISTPSGVANKTQEGKTVNSTPKVGTETTGNGELTLKRKLVPKSGISPTKVSALINLFKPVNPSIQRLFGNTTQRSAMERLIKEHGENKIRMVIEKLPEIVSQPYAPVITTPYMLEAKLGELMLYLQRKKNKGGGVIDAQHIK